MNDYLCSIATGAMGIEQSDDFYVKHAVHLLNEMLVLPNNNVKQI
jgi:hypothetical protein